MFKSIHGIHTFTVYTCTLLYTRLINLIWLICGSKIITSTHYRRTAPGFPRRWCRSEPRGCWDCGTDPECEHWEFHSSDARPRPRETRANRSEQRLGSERSQHQEHAGHPPNTHTQKQIFPKIEHICILICPPSVQLYILMLTLTFTFLHPELVSLLCCWISLAVNNIINISCNPFSKCLLHHHAQVENTLSNDILFIVWLHGDHWAT